MNIKLTHEEFLENLRDKNEAYRSGEFKVIGEYKSRHSYILVETKYGLVNITAANMYKGGRPRIKSAVDKTQYFINRCKEVHGERYDYSLVKYTGCEKLVEIICPIHGLFKQSPTKHIHGQGCSKCGTLFAANKLLKTTEEFIIKATLIHQGRYDYSLSDYTGHNKKIKIICPIHGLFEQRANHHTDGCGCKRCGDELNLFKRGNWVKQAGNKQGIFYIIKCWNDNEEFYKVGITYNNVHKRYISNYHMPYVYEIIREIYSDDKELIWNMEKAYIKKLKDYHYTPQIKFGGSKYECFSHIPKKLLKGKI